MIRRWKVQQKPHFEQWVILFIVPHVILLTADEIVLTIKEIIGLDLRVNNIFVQNLKNLITPISKFRISGNFSFHWA